MLKECTVVMLPTNEKASIEKDIRTNTLGRFAGYFDDFDKSTYIPNHENSYKQFQNLYIISNDIINLSSDKTGIFIRKHSMTETIDIVENPIYNGKYKYFRIIASTDKLGEIKNSVSNFNFPDKLGLPSPTPAFINKYVTEYNNGNIITKVMVEYTGVWSDTDEKLVFQPKVSPDNTITIKPIKTSYTREEVIAIAKKASIKAYCYPEEISTGIVFDETKFDIWIRNNI